MTILSLLDAVIRRSKRSRMYLLTSLTSKIWANYTSYFLGTKILQDEKSGNIWIGQPVYTNNLLKRFGMQDCKAASTPVDTSTKLAKTTSDDECIDQQLYQSAIGSLLYLSVSTRPDITPLAPWHVFLQIQQNNTGQL